MLNKTLPLHVLIIWSFSNSYLDS